MSKLRYIRADFIDGIATKRNLISGGDLERDNLNGWSRYVDSGSRPVDGTGGSPTTDFQLERDANSNVDGVGSLFITKAAANTQGHGISKDFVVGPQSQGRVMVVEFDYRIIATGYQGGSDTTDSDLIVYLRRLTSTARNVEPISFKIPGAVTNFVYKYKGTFQTDVSSSAADLDYRIMIHCATTSTTAYTVAFDNFKISEQSLSSEPISTDGVSYGAIDWQASVTNPTKGTTAVDNITVARDGQFAEIQFNYRHTTAGTAGSGTYLLTLPPGLAVDTTALDLNGSTSGNALGPVVGKCYSTDTLAFAGEGVVVPISSTQFKFFFGPLIWDNVFAANFGDTTLMMSGQIRVPIAGWGANTTILGAEAARTVECSAYKATGQVINTTSTLVAFNSIRSDSHAAFDTSSSRYVVKVAGKFRHSIVLSFYGAVGNSGVEIRFFKNGFQIRSAFASAITAGNGGCNAVFEDIASAGDYYELYAITGGVSLVLYGADAVFGGSTWDIARIAGPEAIGAGEKVYVSAYLQNVTTPGAEANVTNYTAKTEDTHGAFNLTTGVFTAPRPDWYCYSFAGTASSQSQYIASIARKNSTNIKGGIIGSAATGLVARTSVSGGVYLNAGETLNIRAFTGDSVAQTWANTAFTTVLDIWSQG